MMQGIYEFATQLNDKYGYNVTTDRIQRFFTAFDGSGLDFADLDSVIAAMRIMFCETREEQEKLPGYFMRFLKKLETDTYKSAKKRELEKELSEITALKEETIKERDSWIPEGETDEVISLNKAQDKLLSSFKEVSTYIKNTPLAQIEQDKIRDFLNSSVKLGEEALIKGEFGRFNDLEKLHKLLKKVEKEACRIQEERRSKEEEQKRKYADKIKQLEKEQKTKQKELDEILSSNAEETAIPMISAKNDAVSHRREFSGGGAVISKAVGEILEHPFKDMTEKEQVLVEEFLKENLSSFRTRMVRKVERRGAMDMARTIALACRTGGHPLNLVYEKPRKNKADLILILDISGSCKKASSMMLTFMHTLQSLFPRGCHAFVFINNLYDILQIMELPDVSSATSEVLNTIPRAGGYSNYEVPLRQMWDNYNHILRKDSMVIFMGDCRNNTNPSGEEYIRNICRRVKKTWWLNTDEIGKWDQGDSIAGIYGRYTKMREVLTPGDLLACVNEI